jgi:two-component system chemotaxis sensor kinase CheA
MELDEYKKIYLSEAREILKMLNNQMVELEKNSSLPAGQAGDHEIINSIFRGAHTLKGMSATMGYDPIVKLSHSMESVLALVRSQKLKISGEIMDILFKSIDTLDEGVKAVAKGTLEQISVADLIEKLNKILTATVGEDKMPEVIPKVELRLDKETRDKLLVGKEKGLIPWQVRIKLSGDCKMRIARALIVLQQFSALGEVINLEKLLEELKSAKCALEFYFYLLSGKSEAELKEKSKNIPEVDAVNLMIFVPKAGLPDGQAGEATEELAQHFQKTRESAGEKPTVRISVEKLDKLMNLIGEIAISKIRLSDISRRLANKELAEILAYFGRQSTELQAEMMGMRLFPLEYVFANFPRLVRDTAHEEGKEVDLITSGVEIGLDRTVLDEINEPLIHLLRNSVSHGIETPEKRTAAGKDRSGKIYLSASRERNFVIIEVKDDGPGMDSSEIKKHALEKHIISEAEAQELSEEDIFMLICDPNFSTSNKVTETSGRGVGLNVVKTSVEALGGTVSIESQKGQGSTFTLRLPLSVAIMQSLLISLSSETFAIPLSSIAETIKIKTETIKKVGPNSEIINYRGMVLPLLRLREKLGVKNVAATFLSREKSRDRSPSNSSPENGGGLKTSAALPVLPVVVIEHGGKTIGLVVDSLVGQQEIVVKSLRDPLKRLEGVSGATILGSGKVALIIDIGAVIK